MFEFMLFAVAASCLTAFSNPVNLVENPRFEKGVEASGIPASWVTYAEGISPAYSVVDGGHNSSDNSSKEQGKCARLELTEKGKALLMTPKIPVAPGEKMKASVWVRADKFATDNEGGGLAFTVGCLNEQGKYYHWFRFLAADVGKDWTQLTKVFEIPLETRQVVLQLGLNNAQGIVFFDDASVTAESSYTVQMKVEDELESASETVKAVIINREHSKNQVVLKVAVGGAQGAKEVTLSGELEQNVDVPITLKRGAAELSAALEDSSGKVLGKAPARKVNVLGGVELEPLVPTHFCIEDGEPSFDARLWIHTSNESLKGSTLRAVLRDSSGKEIFTKSWDKISSGKIGFKVDAPKAGKGDYELQMELKSSDGSVEKETQTWHIIERRQAKVTISPSGYPVVDGKELFPLGTFNSGRYPMMKECGFTVVHAWNRARTGNGVRPRHQPTKDFLDDAYKAGLKAVLMIPSSLAEKGEWDEVARRVRMFSNHPALLCWVEEEGVARGEIELSFLKRLVGVVHKEDPNHPFCLADSYDVITKVDRARFFPSEIMELGMWWWYPIPLDTAGVTALLEGQDPSEGFAFEPPTFLTHNPHGKPLWVGLQAYRKPKRSDGRLPTPEEYRAMAYMAVIHGGKGLLYYMGGSGWNIIGNTDEKRPWGYLNDLVPELAQMIPAFLAPSAEDKITIKPEKAKISCCVKNVDGKRVVITVNRDNAPVDAVISLPDIGNSPVKVKFENRSVNPADGRLSDHFEPYGVHIYEVEP